MSLFFVVEKFVKKRMTIFQQICHNIRLSLYIIVPGLSGRRPELHRAGPAAGDRPRVSDHAAAHARQDLLDPLARARLPGALRGRQGVIAPAADLVLRIQGQIS